MAALLRSARAAAPEEACGLLFGERGSPLRVSRFLPLPNAAPLGGGFSIDPLAFARAEGRMRAHGLAWLGFAHSHPGGTASPSAPDRGQLWHGCLQLILALHDGAHGGLAAFVLGPRGIRTLPLEVAP